MVKNSILICTHNEEKYIKNTILQLNKYIEDLEIVIVDDASTDNAIKEIESIESSLNVKIIQRSKIKGLGSAFQRVN